MKLTPEQLKRAFTHTVGLPPREADLQVVELMGGTVEVLAEYVWGHWMGEPDRPTVEQVEEQINQLLKEE